MGARTEPDIAHDRAEVARGRSFDLAGQYRRGLRHGRSHGPAEQVQYDLRPEEPAYDMERGQPVLKKTEATVCQPKT